MFVVFVVFVVFSHNIKLCPARRAVYLEQGFLETRSARLNVRLSAGFRDGRVFHQFFRL